MSDVTRILDPVRLEELLPLVYEELRRLAAMVREPAAGLKAQLPK